LKSLKKKNVLKKDYFAFTKTKENFKTVRKLQKMGFGLRDIRGFIHLRHDINHKNKKGQIIPALFFLGISIFVFIAVSPFLFSLIQSSYTGDAVTDFFMTLIPYGIMLFLLFVGFLIFNSGASIA